ncbi:MAG: 4Fe-4S binding protein [Smithellaceae bacterium]|nr:4Fe-4S binding protein [Smithellaceae bacterium]
MRKYLQALSLLLFTLFFFLATYKLPDWFPADLYLRLDPLLGLNAVMASREIIDRVLWSLALVAATLLIGRFFCAYVCPLGAAIDGLDFLFFRKNKRRGLKADEGLRRGKYFLLIIIAAAALIGVSLVYLFDPIALLTRFYTFVLYPALIAFLNLLLDLIRPLAGLFGLVSLSHLHYPQPVFYMTSITLLIFGTIIALNYFTPRFWCRYLCPLGAFLSLISPFGIFKRRVGPDCNRCLVCQQRCPMEAIDQDPFKTRFRECIQCRNCALICPQQAISFPAALGGTGEYSSIDVSRRGFVSSLAGGLTVGFLATQTPFTPLQGKNQLIRPPGALPEREFLRTCIRCGECMKACVTNTIQPSLWESGLSGLWTPKLEMRLAACEPNCHVCGRVCPTRAIRDLSLEEKTHAKVGNAVLWKEKCLVWAQNKLCLICDEICPYNAIVFRPIDGYRRPVVIASRCNGCGYCEEKCPVKGESAIVVVPDGEIRLKTGSYIREAKRLQLDFRPDPGDDKYILEESGFRLEGENKAEGLILPAPKRPSRTPKGFQ